MVYYEKNEWHIPTKQVTYVEDKKTVVKTVGNEGVGWWNDFAEKWPEVGKLKFDDITPTNEQKARLAEVNSLGIGDGFSDVITDFVIDNVFPDNLTHSLRPIEIYRKKGGGVIDEPLLQASAFASRMAVMPMLLNDELDEEEIAIITPLYEDYKVNHAYKVNDIFKYLNELYKVVQAHTSLENWKPDTLPALYWKVLPKGAIGEWVQPQGQVGVYMIGDKVTYEGKTYVSTVDSNVWKPTEYGWEEVI